MARTFLVTGGTGGIGKATAELLTSRGHKVITADIANADINADLTTVEGRQALVDEATKLSEGKLDGVIANAGMQAPTPKTAQVNYFGAVATLEGLRPLLEKSDAPRAVVTASIASLQPADDQLIEAMLAGDEEATVKRGQELADQGPEVAYLNYSSSKQAIARWVRKNAISEEWAGKGIALNAIAPAVVISPMTEELRNTDEGRAQLAQVPMPLNGWMPAEAAASFIAWLTSEENTHLCGQVVFIDGGFDATVRGDKVW
ncbi:SDR family NAD(P)-dependent oxidoreductase [Corynebacterium coyleae]|uniref:SDR family oxidoreductase n=1 Tax=Corynebacterium coyleae TaxID=53374 RepID=A0AAP6XHY2_9CORY|nr:SDR family NAD(P)-dependent oxidoreductase [Corynebacterium coyleae]MDK8662825.1 SDR family oxidoreductase [Corynebacterium coyleae]MDK8706129.1 SDR family oxidoreductase [Corynebacterium coyleae]MDK8732784.1 SDR family oxidoreductase [Corynebacterium coyleae]MDK8892170.1 SDR family oxidoreductase [Corynebacterium coyleae]NJJ02876.1 SDR family oxidoreductase [Corynebacterium coyleae]